MLEVALVLDRMDCMAYILVDPREVINKMLKTNQGVLILFCDLFKEQYCMFSFNIFVP